MGREVMRVPMDFDHPQRMVWPGYLLPEYLWDPQDEAGRREADTWQPQDPPEGHGYQMWETTSEGSPISPVFATPEELAHWLADTNASAFGGEGASYESWLGMINGPGDSVSMVIDGGVMMSGVEFAARTTGELP